MGLWRIASLVGTVRSRGRARNIQEGLPTDADFRTRIVVIQSSTLFYDASA